MTSRIRFGSEFVTAIQVRALTLSEIAALAKVSRITVSSAAQGRAINASTALRIARAVASRPAIQELVEWVKERGEDERLSGFDGASPE
jgi:transcriptional regulator with XRE-family HTH domain